MADLLRFVHHPHPHPPSHPIPIPIIPDAVLDVRSGGGLLLAVDTTITSEALINRCAEMGLLLIPAGPNTIRLAPPLTIEVSHAQEAVDILKAAVDQLS